MPRKRYSVEQIVIRLQKHWFVSDVVLREREVNGTLDVSTTATGAGYERKYGNCDPQFRIAVDCGRDERASPHVKRALTGNKQRLRSRKISVSPIFGTSQIRPAQPK